MKQPATQSTEDEFDLLAVIGTIWRGKLWIALTTLLAVLAGGYYAFEAAVPVYTAQTTLALESRQEQVVSLDSVVSGLSGDQATINTEVEVLRSRRLAERLVDQMDLMSDPEFNAELREPAVFSLGALIGYVRNALGIGPSRAPRDPATIRNATVDELRRAISISSVRQSYVYNLTVVTTSPEKSAAIANKMAELYIQNQLEMKFEATETATEWLTERVSELKIELEHAEALAKEFSSNTDLVSVAALAALNRQLKDLRVRVEDERLAVKEAETRLDALQLAREANDLAQIDRLAQDATLSRILVELQDGADQSRFDARLRFVVDRAQGDLRRSRKQIDTLVTSIAEMEKQIEDQSTDLVELQQLQREAEANRLIYEYFLSRLKETAVQKGIQQADSWVLSRAVEPVQPSAPRKSLVLALSGLFGLVLGSAIVLLREMANNTFRTPEELEEFTGYTVMGSIPTIPARKRRKILQYVLDNPTSHAAEAVRNLRTSIMMTDVDNPPRVVMSTSTVPGEGKTTQSLMLAQNMAMLGKKVLLIEGDIRRRVFAEYFDRENAQGIVSVLLGDVSFDDAVYHEEKLGVDILIGEQSGSNAADLYSSDKFEAFLSEMREKYDLVIIDTPPVLVVPDARVIGRFVDAIIYTVKWDSSLKSQVRAGLRMFESVGLKVTGLVLGQVDPKGMKRYGYHQEYTGYYKN